MLSLDEIREKLKTANRAEVARAVGVTRSYISALANMERINPSYELIKKLSDYFETGRGAADES